MQKWSSRVWLALALIGMLFPALSFARDIPALTGPVVDEAGIFSSQPQLKADLENALQNYQRQNGVQMQVLTLASLGGDNLEDFSIRAAEAWKIGDAGQDKGLIVIFALADRQVRIEVGQGLEGDLPDVKAGRVIREVMIPAFQQKQFAEGMVQGLHAVAHELGHDLGMANLPVHRPRKMDTGRGALNLLFVLVFVVVFMIRLFRFRGGYYGGSGFSGGRYSGGGFSGGGWSGGGGGFSGGGASGRW